MTIVPNAKASVAHSEIRQAALRIIAGLPVSENIAHTSHCSNEGPMALNVDLPSQPVNMHVHDIRVRLNSHTPYLIENH
jgi:hypothetical protein